MKRPFVCLAVLLGAATNSVAAQTVRPADAAAPVPISSNPFLAIETYRLWPGRAEHAASDEPAESPTITIIRPQQGYANGAAIVVAPGGGYVALASSLEGRQVADWFASRGVTAFVVQYRVGAKARLPIPLADGRRAVRFVRAHARSFGIDPDRIGMIGFSAGGHLSAMTAATADRGRESAQDPIERASSRPDFLVLGYPWLEGTALDAEGRSQYCTFAQRFEPKSACRPGEYQDYLPLRLVTSAMPPTFIYHTTADKLVPAEGSLRFYEALKAQKVPVELHVFASGEHGTGLGGSDPSLTQWPLLLENWLRGLGVFVPKK